MAGIAVVDRVQDEFNAGGDAELFEDAVEILLDCVFAKVEFAGNLGRREVGRKISQNAQFTFSQWLLQCCVGRVCPLTLWLRQAIKDFGNQRGMGGVSPAMSLEQIRNGIQ